MIAIIDYGVGNINAFINVYRKLSIDIKRATNENDLNGATRLILPGVGAFDHAMSQFESSGMHAKVEKMVIQDKIPILGVCVGMQMLAKSSTEGNLPGLGWIDGTVKRFNSDDIPFETKFPHMGWNKVTFVKQSPLFDDMKATSEFYFLHSYYFQCNNENNILSIANYGVEFTVAVNHENIYGIQCHPEKSHQDGVQLLKNFANL